MKYDNNVFRPSAPMINLDIRINESDELNKSNIFVRNVPFILDTGSTYNFVPSKSINDLCSLLGETKLPGDQVEVQYYGNGIVPRNRYFLTVSKNYLFRNEINDYFIENPTNCGIIGRGLLNKTTLLLDGQNDQWYRISNCLRGILSLVVRDE